MSFIYTIGEFNAWKHRIPLWKGCFIPENCDSAKDSRVSLAEKNLPLLKITLEITSARVRSRLRGMVWWGML